MASRFIPWGEDLHKESVVGYLTWIDNIMLQMTSKKFASIDTTVDPQVWWGQAQSTDQGVETLVSSLISQRKVLTPSAKPNLAMLWIDSDVLLSSTVRDLCGRLHSARLVPRDCPILVVESDAGVFGAGVAGEGSFSAYEGRDVELDPLAPVTAVLTVGYIPPEAGGDNGSAPLPRVRCFIVDDLPQNRRQGLRESVDGVAAVMMECAPLGSATAGLASPGARTSSVGAPKTGVANDLGDTPTAPASRSETGVGSSKGSQPPLRKSTRTSTVASSRASSRSVPPPELSPPSSSVPLENADTVLLVGDHPRTLERTSDWLQKLLGDEAMILGGISSCALCVGNQVFPRDKARRTSRPGVAVPLVAGVALRGVHALAISANGLTGVGPLLRVDATIDQQGNPQARKGKVLRDVTVVTEEGVPAGTRTALSILFDEVRRRRDLHYALLGVGASPAELLACRGGEGQGSASEEAKGSPPLRVESALGNAVLLNDDVSPGQYARFMRRTPQQVLTDTESAYQSCKRRMEREGSVVLSSIHFTCSVRPDRVEVSSRQEQPQQGQGQDQDQQPGEGENGDAVATRVMALHQQEMVRFIKTLGAPAAGVFCEGELGPVATLASGISPKTARSDLQGWTTCSAVLCWNPASVGSPYPASRVPEGM
ncbi:unnamed protein product [Scytosiphon promiscuus]